MPEARYTNRRQWVRTSIQKPVTLLVESDRSNVAHDVVTVDVSEQGARVQGEIRVTPGQSVDLIPKDGGKKPIPSRIIWVDLKGPGRNGEAGLRFAEPTRLPYALSA